MSTAALLTAEQPSTPPARSALIMEPPMVAGSPEWQALRRTGIGGSDAAAALGLSHWTTPFELWLDKRGQLPPRLDEDNGPLLWGRLMEPLVRQVYAQRTGHEVDVPNTTFRSSEYPWMLANLDGIARRPGLLTPFTSRIYEGKTARSSEGWGEPGSADIPMVYTVQTQHYMRILRVDVTDVAVLIGGNDFRIYEVPADRELQELIVEAEAEFWQRVVNADPPPPEGIEDVKLRWGALAAKGAVVADLDLHEAIRTLRDAVEHRKDLEAVEAECKATLMTALADHGDTLVDVDGHPLVTWKLAAAPRRFDAEAFAAEHPGLYTDYMRAGKASRRFLLKAAA